MTRGAKTKLTPEVQDRIIEALTAGNYQETAARYAGVHVATFYTWMAKGEDPNANAIYREFREAVESAKARAEVKAVALINHAAQGGTWQAAAWWLERTRPYMYGRKDRTEITGANGGPVKIDTRGDLTDRLLERLEEYVEGDDDTA